MKDTKRVFYCYAVWECEKEAARLTEYSAKGWHAETVHLFGATLRRDESVRYVYQGDRRAEIADERYFDTYRELGWEFVDSCNRCYYFRKPYDEKAPAEEYELYSDAETIADNFRCDVRAFGILTAVYGLLTLMNIIDAVRAPSVFHIAGAVSMSLFTVIFLLIALSMRRRMKNGKSGLLSGGAMMLLTLLALLVALLPVRAEKVFAREYLYTNMSWGAYENPDAPDEPASDSLDFTVEKDGECLVDVEINCAQGTVGLELVDSEGNICYNIDPCMQWDAVETVELPAGDYSAVYTANKTADTTIEISVRPKMWYNACA